jgi:hypothetical protein
MTTTTAAPSTSGPYPWTTAEELSDEIARVFAHRTGATYRLLVLIRAFDELDGWDPEGFKSCADWFAWRVGVTPSTAREHVRVARALGELPILSRRVETGELSYSVARALTRVATTENEEELVQVAMGSTAAQMEKLVSAWRRTDRIAEVEAERERHRNRQLSLVRDSSDGSYVIRGRLDPEAGAALERALVAAEDALFGEEGAPGGETVDAHRPRAARRADALGRVAEAALSEGLGGEAKTADRYQVVLHVTAETLEGSDDVSAETSDGGADRAPRIEGGPRVSAETARRLACDAGVVGMIHTEEGDVLDVGRKTRTVPPALRRALEARDGGRCRFPGCVTRFCDAHHITPWAEGGETSLENLVLLCRRHHRRVHEDGWTLERLESDGTERGRLRFVKPDGGELPRVPERPRAPEAAVTELKSEQEGLGVDAWTAVNDWMGAGLAVDLALDWLRRPEDGWDGSGDAPPDVSAETSDPEPRFK